MEFTEITSDVHPLAIVVTYVRGVGGAHRAPEDGSPARPPARGARGKTAERTAHRTPEEETAERNAHRKTGEREAHRTPTAARATSRGQSGPGGRRHGARHAAR